MVDLRSKQLWVDPNGPGYQQAKLWESSNPAGAKIMKQLAQVPLAKWVGDWVVDPAKEVDKYLTAAADKLVMFVVYNICKRDLGSYSGGGAKSAGEYRSFIDSMATGMKGRLCLFAIEPDALPMAPRMSLTDQAERYALIRYAVEKLTNAGGLVYIDAGDSGWITNHEQMVTNLIKSGIEVAEGITSNLAHFRTTRNEHTYCQALRELVKIETGKDIKYIIDTGRNGRGPYDVKPGESSQMGWCNPPNAGLGLRPSLKPNLIAYPGCAGYMWIKNVFASDGEREGAPKAGALYPQQLIRMYWNALPKFPELEF